MMPHDDPDPVMIANDDPDPVMMSHDDPDREMIQIRWLEDGLKMKMTWRRRWLEDEDDPVDTEKKPSAENRVERIPS